MFVEVHKLYRDECSAGMFIKWRKAWEVWEQMNVCPYEGRSDVWWKKLEPGAKAPSQAFIDKLQSIS